MTLYVEDDNHVKPCPVKCTRPLLRFRHNVGDILTIDPNWHFDIAVENMFRYKDYKPNHYGAVDFWGQISVPIVCKRGYTGTTATLFASDGNFIAQAITKLHPQDQFCKLTGRQITQQRFIKCFSNPMFISDSLSSEILARLLLNKTAQPLNW